MNTCCIIEVLLFVFQATLHGYVLSNETVDPIIPQLINAVRKHSDSVCNVFFF